MARVQADNPAAAAYEAFVRDFSSHWESVEPDPDCELACGGTR